MNSRQPNVSRGDLYAQIAASQRGAERITKLLQRYGLPPWNAALKDAYAIGEKRAKKGLASLPPGKWAIEEKQCLALSFQPKQFVIPTTIVRLSKGSRRFREGSMG